MKKSNLILALTLFALGSMFTSCSMGKGCKGGGWYGDRNLSSITPETEAAQQSVEFYSETICAD